MLVNYQNENEKVNVLADVEESQKLWGKIFLVYKLDRYLWKLQHYIKIIYTQPAPNYDKLKCKFNSTELLINYLLKHKALFISLVTSVNHSLISVVLSGEWKSEQRPLIYGGAAHSRRYLFHSMALHLPSEHTVGGLQYPLESQALYVSAEYKGVEEALEASPSDPQAFLAVANLYKVGSVLWQKLSLYLIRFLQQNVSTRII